MSSYAARSPSRRRTASSCWRLRAGLPVTSSRCRSGRRPRPRMWRGSRLPTTSGSVWRGTSTTPSFRSSRSLHGAERHSAGRPPSSAGLRASRRSRCERWSPRRCHSSTRPARSTYAPCSNRSPATACPSRRRRPRCACPARPRTSSPPQPGRRSTTSSGTRARAHMPGYCWRTTRPGSRSACATMAPEWLRTGWQPRAVTAGSASTRASSGGCGRSAEPHGSTRRQAAERRWSCVCPAADDAPLRVLVVDDHPIWRDGVARDLEAAGIVVCGTAGDVAQAVRVATATRPDVVLLDLHLPDGSGVDVAVALAKVDPPPHILVLSASGERQDVLDALTAGATGYLVKSASIAELVDAVRRVAVGDAVFTPGLAGLVLGEYRRLASSGPGEQQPRLTERETEILRLVAKGLTYPQIAERLVLSVRTVQNHVQNTLTKLQLHNKAQLVRYALEQGLGE